MPSCHPVGLRSPNRRCLLLLALLTTLCPGVVGPVLAARPGDGTLLLGWTREEAVRTGVSRILPRPTPPEELSVALRGADRERLLYLAGTSPLRIDGLDPGVVRIELRHGMGVLRNWEILIRPETATAATLDLNLGTLTVLPFSPEPFGNWETWEEAELRTLPGLAEDVLDGIDTHASPGGDTVLDGMPLVRADRLRNPTIDLVDAFVGAARPLGTLPATRDGNGGRRLLTRGAPGDRLDLGGSGGNGGRYLAYADLARHRENPDQVLDLSGRIQWSGFDVTGPVEVVGGSRDHDGRDAVEVRARLLHRRSFGRVRADFYAQGSTRDYYVHEFANDLPHAPREDRASLRSVFAYDTRALGQDLSIELGYGREFSETGDGEEFDEFLGYSRAREFEETGPDGLYWLGDDPTTPRDEGRLFDYYERSLTEDLTFRADLARDHLVPRGFRAGAELRWTRWRLFEHLAPSQVVFSGDAGYQMTRNFGYTRDGDEQDGSDGHTARMPRRLALFATQRATAGALELELGLRFDRFSPGQNPLANRTDPLGRDGGEGNPELLDGSDLRTRPDHDQISPRAGLYAPVGRRTHLWLDGGRRQIVPPYEAVFYDPGFLALQAGLADQLSDRDRFAAAAIHGNPDLSPEDEWSAQLGLYHQRSANLGIRLSGRVAHTADTWVARSYERRAGAIQFYENSGTRRELGLHAGIDLATTRTSALRVQYDLARTETDVIEPFPLYEHLLLRGRPIEDIAVPQTRLRSELWLDDGVDRGFFPSLLDRTHRLAISWVGEAADIGLGTRGPYAPRFAFVFRGASGAPYTPTYVVKEGDLEASTDPLLANDPDRIAGEIHSERMPWVWQFDVAYIQPMEVLGRPLDLRVEVRNATDRKNAQYVHPATGEPDDDGWLDTVGGRAETASDGNGYRAQYLGAIEDPLSYTDGLEARIGLRIALF